MTIVRRHPSVRADLKKLRKYRTAPKAIEAFERLLTANAHIPKDAMPGLRTANRIVAPTVYKARVICQELGGKRSGLRYIYEETVGNSGEVFAVCVMIYVHASDVPEHEVIHIVRDRLSTYSADQIDGFDEVDL